MTIKIQLRFAITIIVLALVTLGATELYRQRTDTDHFKALMTQAPGAVNYERDVRPVLDRRCVVCHGCYDAPCQLKLSSSQGISRGASKDAVYDASRLTPMEPTRLFVDATSTEAWRRKGFSSVTEGGDKAASVLMGMLHLGRDHPHIAGEPLPKSVELDINRDLSCPTTPAEFADYAHDTPFGGMPYGTAPLTNEEFRVLSSWADNGAPVMDVAPELTLETRKAIVTWEELLNGTSNKAKLSARYLYEHLFLAHLYFSDSTENRFFRLVRSRTPTGEPIVEIGTRHPFDDPGPEPSFYRLRPITSTIVSKTHIVYPLSAAKLERIRSLFFDATWAVSQLPGYAAGTTENPFITFADIPSRSRYQFLLDDVRYTIMTFIRGPVCRGQVALNVIDDNFFVAFLDPDYDLAVSDPDFLPQAKSLINIPEESTSPLTLLQQWSKYYNSHRAYLSFRENAYFEHDPEGREVTLDAIWPGNAFSPVSFLTVFRHFDSASVVNGFVGELPKKIWVLDYQILERIYYNLVANYDVFGNVTHQLLTRLSMDYARMEAEGLALSFMPMQRRQDVRAGWYAGAGAQLALYLGHSLPERQRPSSINYERKDVARELMTLLLERHPRFAIRLDDGHPLTRLSQDKGGFLKWMPDVSFLKVEGDDRFYSLLRNKAHDNVAFIFGEDLRRNPDEDTLTVVEGIVGNYPNFFFRVSHNDLGRFVDDLRAVNDEKSFQRFVEVYGVRRSSREFWAMSDWFNERFVEQQPVEAGLLDLSRFRNY